MDRISSSERIYFTIAKEKYTFFIQASPLKNIINLVSDIIVQIKSYGYRPEPSSTQLSVYDIVQNPDGSGSFWEFALLSMLDKPLKYKPFYRISTIAEARLRFPDFGTESKPINVLFNEKGESEYDDSVRSPFFLNETSVI